MSNGPKKIPSYSQLVVGKEFFYAVDLFADLMKYCHYVDWFCF